MKMSVEEAAIAFWETIEERDLTGLTANQGFAWQLLCDAIRDHQFKLITESLKGGE